MNTAGVGGYFMGGSKPPINNIQRGTIAHGDGAATATATITAVVLANSFHSYAYYSSTDTTKSWGDFAGQQIGLLELTNTTTLTSTFALTSDGFTRTVSYEAVEFVTGILQNSQRGTLTVSGANNTATATLTAFSTTKSTLLVQGWETNRSWATGSGAGFAESTCRLEITNTTTLTITRGGNTGSPTHKINYTVPSWN